MKGGGGSFLHGLRGKQTSLILIALICTSIFIWAWDNSNLLTTLVPHQDHLLVNSPETAVVDIPKQDISLREDIANVVIPEEKTRTEQTEQSSNFVASIDSNSDSTSKESIDDENNNIGSSLEKKDISSKEDVSNDIAEGESITKQAKMSSVDSFGSETSNTPETSNEGGEEDIVASISKKEGGTTTGQVEKSPKVKPIGSGLEGNRETSLDDGKSVSSLTKNDEIMMVVALNTTKPKQNLEGEKPDIPKKVFDFVTPEVNNPEGKVDSLVDGPVRKKEACNYAKGKWIEDSKRPLYSGFGCKQWLSDMWACRLTQRTDFAYETFRWKPFNCEMPDFEAASFLKRMQHKTIAIIGDSLGRQQFQSLMCMATGGQDRPDVINVGWEYELRKPRGAVRPDGWAYRFPSTNTTILYYWSASLCDLEPINISDKNTDWAMHLDRPPAFLRRYLDRFDVLVLNTGHHWNRGKLNANRWVMHIGGVPNTDRKLAEIGRAKNFTIYSIANWVNLQLPKHPRLKAFFRTISPRHFFNGDWNTGGSCDNTTPLAGGKEVTQDESLDPSVAGAVNGTEVKLLDITAISQLRDEGHISRYSIRATPGMQDCLHWCLPGIPDTWNELLIAQL